MTKSVRIHNKDADPDLYSLTLDSSLTVQSDDFCTNYGLCADSYFATDSNNLLLLTNGNLHLFPLGGPMFELSLTCQYDNQPAQSYIIELLINEKDGRQNHKPPIIQALPSGTVEIPEGLYRPPNNLVLNSNQLQFSSEDKISEENVEFSIDTTPEQYSSSLEITNLNRQVPPTLFQPNQVKVNFTAEMHIIEPIFDETEIEVCFTIETFISQRRQRQGSRECFILLMLNEDNHPPLFCSRVEIENDRGCAPSIEIITISLTDIGNGFTLPMNEIEAIDGDLSSLTEITYELSQESDAFVLDNNLLVVNNTEAVKIENILVVTARQANNAAKYSTKTFNVILDQTPPTYDFLIPEEISVRSLGPIEADNLPLRITQNAALISYLGKFENYELLWTIDSEYLTVSSNGNLFYSNLVTASRLDEVPITVRMFGNGQLVDSVTKRLTVEFSG